MELCTACDVLLCFIHEKEKMAKNAITEDARKNILLDIYWAKDRLSDDEKIAEWCRDVCDDVKYIECATYDGFAVLNGIAPSDITIVNGKVYMVFNGRSRRITQNPEWIKKGDNTPKYIMSYGCGIALFGPGLNDYLDKSRLIAQL